jgi:SAM-dependent methyltransferase/protein tyrosine phosphatase (PTP) superfamily phosphohydrolase (DUF442 family)
MSLAVAIVFLVPPLSAFAQSAPPATDSSPVEAASLGQTATVHRIGTLWTAGQFEPSDLDEIRSAGVERIITLRTPGEIEWDEKQVIEDAGLQYIEIPFAGPDELTDDIFDAVRDLLRESDQKPTLLHCASANRVGGVWLAYRVLDQKVTWETALSEARTIGLRTDGYIERAREYIDARLLQSVIPPELNKDFLDPNLDVDQWLARFEVESREIFAHRLEILKLCGIRAGDDVADVGAGTGLFTRLMAHETGPDGRVFAVEISPAFLTHINALTTALSIANVTSVLCREDSVTLPDESIDLAFVCDTYHHFAYPQATLASIRSALRPGGQLIVVDFERIPGESRQWVLDHVRASKETVREEIEQAGFEFVDEPAVAGLEENYMLQFRKPAESTR